MKNKLPDKKFWQDRINKVKREISAKKEFIKFAENKIKELSKFNKVNILWKQL